MSRAAAPAELSRAFPFLALYERGDSRASGAGQRSSRVSGALESASGGAAAEHPGAALAVAMALHPRLGAESPLSVLSDDLLHRIVLLVSLQSPSHRSLAAINCRADWCIRQLDLHYITSKGVQTTSLRGGKGCVAEPLLLACGEHVVQARGSHGGGLLYSLQLVTSLGRAGPMWGAHDSGGRAFEILPFVPSDESLLDRLPAWLRATGLSGNREDGMDMHDVAVDLAHSSVEHTSRGHFQPQPRLQLLKGQPVLAAFVEAPGLNRVAKQTGGVGRLVGIGAHAPPPQQGELLHLLYQKEFEDLHARAATGRLSSDQGLARKLIARLSFRRSQ